MGNGSSFHLERYDTETPLPLELQYLIDLYPNLGFRAPEILKLRDIFLSIDKNDSNSLYFNEFIGSLNLPNDLRERDGFCRRCFSFFDPHSTEEIEFDEFLITTWHYCSMKADQFLEFAFDLYDPDLSGKIEANAIILMLIDLHGENLEMIESAKKVLSRIERDQHCEQKETCILFTKEDFDDFYRLDTSLLWPAHQLLERMRTRFGGKKFWNLANKLRTQKEDCGEYPGISLIKSIKEKAQQREQSRSTSGMRLQRSLKKKKVKRRMSRKISMFYRSGNKFDTMKGAARRLSMKVPRRGNNLNSVKNAARKISVAFFAKPTNLPSVRNAARKMSMKFPKQPNKLNSMRGAARKMSTKFPSSKSRDMGKTSGRSTGRGTARGVLSSRQHSSQSSARGHRPGSAHVALELKRLNHDYSGRNVHPAQGSSSSQRPHSSSSKDNASESDRDRSRTVSVSSNNLLFSPVQENIPKLNFFKGQHIQHNIFHKSQNHVPRATSEILLIHAEPPPIISVRCKSNREISSLDSSANNDSGRKTLTGRNTSSSKKKKYHADKTKNDNNARIKHSGREKHSGRGKHSGRDKHKHSAQGKKRALIQSKNKVHAAPSFQSDHSKVVAFVEDKHNNASSAQTYGHHLYGTTKHQGSLPRPSTAPKPSSIHRSNLPQSRPRTAPKKNLQLR